MLRTAIEGLKLLFFIICRMHLFNSCNLFPQLLRPSFALWSFLQDVLRAAIQGLKLFFVDASQGGDLGSAPKRQKVGGKIGGGIGGGVG